MALACPHMLDALAAVSVSGLTSPPTSDLRIFLLSGLSGLERWLEGFDGNFVVGTQTVSFSCLNVAGRQIFDVFGP